MEKIFYPESVAVFGVSTRSTNLGRNIILNLQHFGFRGPIYAVGGDDGDINGVHINRGVEDLSGVPDIAVFLLPARYIPEALEACGCKGIRRALIMSGGFSEFAEQGRKLEEEILAIAKRWEMRVVGPNCVGIFNRESNLVLSFVPFDKGELKKGNISIVSQSGGVALEGLRLLCRETLGFNKIISMGNKIDVNENDFLDFLRNDPNTQVVGFYLENVAHGARLMELAGKTDKPLIVLKANTNPVSHHAARFHTAALAGDDEVVTAAFRQAGIHRVQNLTEMMDAFKVFSLPVLKGPRLAVLGRSGGQAVLLADAVHRYGLELAKLSDDFFSYVKQHIRAGVIRMSNPLDMGDIFSINTYIGIVEKALSEDGVDGVVFSHLHVADQEIAPTKQLLDASLALSHSHGKPVIPCIVPDRRNLFSRADALLFEDVDMALKALSRSLWHHRFQSGKRKSAPKRAARSRKILALKRGFMAPDEAFPLLGSYGVPHAEIAVAGSVDEVVKAARHLRYPVALKTADPDVLHKTESGGVALDIGGEQQLRKAFRIMKAGRCLVQKMAPAGTEVILGARKDHEFGHVILFGLGGIFVELLKDTAMRVLPVTAKEAESMVLEIRAGRLLKGFRGRGPLDVKALAHCIAGLSKLLVDHPEIRTIDINPLILYGKGQGCLAVDAKIEVS